MATLMIHQTEHLPVQHGSVAPVIYAAQTGAQATAVSYTTAASSAAFHSNTRYVTLSTGGTAAHVAFGTAPTATANYLRIPANSVMTFEVDKGASWKVSAYDGTS